MHPFAVFIILLFMGGIIFLTNPFGDSKATREDFLEKLSKYLEGTLESVKEKDNSYRLYFKYYERQFVFEDLMEVGFSKEMNRGYLKNKTNTAFNLSFRPIEKGGIVHSETIIASDLDNLTFQEKIEIKLPEELKVFKIETSDPILAKRLIEDPKIGHIICYYKDADVKGKHRMSLQIKNGVIIVAFHPSIMRHPSLVSLRTNLQMIDDHLEKLSALADAINDVQA